MKTPDETMNRRTFLKKATQGAAVFATASMGPWFIKDALSSSGTLNLFTWPDYSKPEVIAAFEKKYRHQGPGDQLQHQSGMHE